MEKVLQELFWVHFLGCRYCSNGTKIHLDLALITLNIIMLLGVFVKNQYVQFLGSCRNGVMYKKIHIDLSNGQNISPNLNGSLSFNVTSAK